MDGDHAAAAEARSATASHSHLFPGARLEFEDGSAAPGRLELRLSDGTEVVAELIEFGDGIVLSVAGFTTRAGTEIGPRVWLVRSIEHSGDSVVAILGPATELS
ncbi:MAG: hypothetical protein KIT69_04080 [Propionibacteriaceae bacterium]|nr:hypothetical protein [Propionibacteriaceae bacterium]